MFKIKLADLVIEIDNKYDFIKNQCKDYIVDDPNVDIKATCTEEDIKKEQGNYVDAFSSGYCESVCIYRAIALQLPLFDAFLMHAAVVDVDGKAYAFAARSGTGKSTHLMLWGEYLKDRLTVVNGDKPIMRYINGTLYAFGTPWCGKEGWHKNMRSPLNAICFLERSLENRIEKLEKGTSAELIMKQILMPSDPICAIKTLELLDKMIQNTDTWLLGCNISIDAAKLSYNTMSGENK